MKKQIDIDFDYSKVKGSTELHNKFKKEFTIEANRRFDNIMVLPYDVAFVRAYMEPEKCFRVGQEGVLDTIVITPDVTLWLDMKTGKNKLQTNQIDFIRRVEQIKGEIRGFKINSVRQGLDLIEDFRK